MYAYTSITPLKPVSPLSNPSCFSVRVVYYRIRRILQTLYPVCHMHFDAESELVKPQLSPVGCRTALPMLTQVACNVLSDKRIRHPRHSGRAGRE